MADETLEALGEDELYELSWMEIVMWCILYGMISFLAFFGNIFVIVVTLTRLRNRSVTTFFIINLAFADLLTALFAIPFKFQAALFQVWHLPASLCHVVPYVETVSLSVSVFTLTASAIHEFRTVFFPKQVRMTCEKARILVTVIWIVAILVSLPHGLFHQVYSIPESENVTIQQCRPVYADEGWWKIYNVYLFIIHYFVPMVILDTAYTMIALRIYTVTVSSDEMRRLSLTPQSSGVSNHQLMKMLIIVVAVFTLCWMPLESYLLVNEVLPQINEWRYINVFFFCAHWLAMSNSCLNPIIYGVFNNKYKREYIRLFNCIRHGKVENDLDSPNSFGRHSTMSKRHSFCEVADKEAASSETFIRLTNGCHEEDRPPRCECRRRKFLQAQENPQQTIPKDFHR